MDLCLQKGAAARKYSIALGTLEYSGDLADQMLSFSGKMEKTYRRLRDLVKHKVEDPAQYGKFFAVIQDKMNWYEKAEARLPRLKHVKYIAYMGNVIAYHLRMYPL